MSGSKKTAARAVAVQFMLRLPEKLKNKIAERANANATSMNAEIVEALQRDFEEQDSVSALLDLIEERRMDIEQLPDLRHRVELLEKKYVKKD